MPKNNPYFPKLPETATISYYNPETDQNLTFEEGNKLNSTANPSEIRIINQGEVYHSGKAGVDYSAYGPMPFVDSQALTIAGSQSIMSRIRTDFSKVADLLDGDPDLTLAFLKQENAFSAYLGQNAFNVPCAHSDNYSKIGPSAGTEYHTKIKEYVSEICQRTSAIRENYEVLGKAREDLAEYIGKEYYKVLPYWPNVGQTNTRSVEVNTGGSYENSNKHVVGNCLGGITVEDKRPASQTFMASFRGSPEIKLLMLNLYEMRRINDKCNRLGIEEAKKEIKNYMGDYKRIGGADF